LNRPPTGVAAPPVRTRSIDANGLSFAIDECGEVNAAIAGWLVSKRLEV